MRRTRFMSLLFLALSLAFLGVQDFRWALQLATLGLPVFFQPESRLLRSLLPSEGQVRALRQEAEQSGNAEQLAFAALHWPYQEREEGFRVAEQAVARDPKLTWIYYQVAGRYPQQWKEAPVADRLRAWVQQLESFDPDNAVPALFGAELIRERTSDWPSYGQPRESIRKYLAGQTEWRAAMERAFQRPRLDEYGVRRFELERRVLQERGWATPPVVVFYVATYHLPSLLNIREFADFKANYLGRQAQQAGRMKEAIKTYNETVAFGRRLRQDGPFLIEQLIGTAVEIIGSEPLIEALKKEGRTDEAALAALGLSEIRTRRAGFFTREPLLRSSVPYWSAVLVHLFTLLVILFGVLTVASVVYVNAKRWIRPERRGRLYQVMTIAENYLPILLFVSCIGLYLLYTPYGNNFRYYLAVKEPIHQLEPLILNIFPFWGALPGFMHLPVERPFWDYVPWAVLALVVVVALAAWDEWRVRKQRRGPQAQQAQP